MEQNNNLIRAPLEMFTAADVEPKEISWLWYPYISFGKVSLMQGDSGDGKSTFALNLAAILSRGDTLPFTEVSHEPMKVIYLNIHYPPCSRIIVPAAAHAFPIARHVIHGSHPCFEL